VIPLPEASFETIASREFDRRSSVPAIPQDEAGGCCDRAATAGLILRDREAIVSKDVL